MNELNPLEITRSIIRLQAEVVCLHISIGTILALKLAINQHSDSEEVKKAIMDAETSVKDRIERINQLLEQEQSKANSVMEMYILKQPSMKLQ